MVKLTIGITFCDKDCARMPHLLRQIEQRVKISHEVITIDNTEKGRMKQYVTYSFGYNAYQYEARAKIIELAQGEYIWFIDGDDDIVGTIKEFPYTEDIIVFSFITDAIGIAPVTPQVIKGNIFTFSTCCPFYAALWNKFIKRSLYCEQYERGLKIVMGEDSLWLYRALKHARSVRVVKDIWYRQYIGVSNKLENITLADFDHLLTGHDDLERLMKKELGDEFSKEAIRDSREYMKAYAARVDDAEEVLKRLMEILPQENIVSMYQNGDWDRDEEKSYRVRALIAQAYGLNEEELDIFACETKYDDGRTETLYFNRRQKPEE